MSEAGAASAFGLARWGRRHRSDTDIILAGSHARAAMAAGELCDSGPNLMKPNAHRSTVRRAVHASAEGCAAVASNHTRADEVHECLNQKETENQCSNDRRTDQREQASPGCACLYRPGYRCRHDAASGADTALDTQTEKVRVVCSAADIDACARPTKWSGRRPASKVGPPERSTAREFHAFRAVMANRRSVDASSSCPGRRP